MNIFHVLEYARITTGYYADFSWKALAINLSIYNVIGKKRKLITFQLTKPPKSPQTTTLSVDSYFETSTTPDQTINAEVIRWKWLTVPYYSVLGDFYKSRILAFR